MYIYMYTSCMFDLCGPYVTPAFNAGGSFASLILLTSLFSPGSVSLCVHMPLIGLRQELQRQKCHENFKCRRNIILVIECLLISGLGRPFKLDIKKSMKCD